MTLVTPYIVLGRWMVSWGVKSCGVSGPKEPMELGVKTAQPVSRATSRTLNRPPTPMCQANWGLTSATALSRAAKLKMVSIL